MQDFIGLGIILFVVLCGLYGLSRVSRREELTQEEYDKRLAQGHGAVGRGITASMTSLQELLQPKAAEAVAVQRDMRQGYYDAKQKKADGDNNNESESETTKNNAP